MQLPQPSVPPDARCAVHPSAPAQVICVRCGAFACAACTGFSERYCAACAPQEHFPATRSSRFVANLLDSMVVSVPFVILAIVSAVLTLPSAGARTDQESSAAVLIGFGLAGLVGIGGGLGAQIWAQLQWGQSLGKRLMNIKVLRTNGADVDLWRLILLRNVVVNLLAQFCGFISLVDALMIFSQDQRCLHDHLADTIVVQHPRESIQHSRESASRVAY
jgi:uncharacterized RDD family membrane protein YckC